MTFAVKAVSGGEWMLCEPARQYTLGGVVYWGRVLIRMEPEALEDKGLALAETLGAPPVPGLGQPPALSDVEGVPTWIWSPGGIANLRALRVGEIKAQARTRILAIMDVDQQRNALARGQEVVFEYGSDPAAWPEPEQAEFAAIMGQWAQIKAIRLASNAIEAALPEDADALSVFDATTDAGWPA